MKISQKGLIEIVGHEGICLKPYLDSVGVWTIGVGATKSEIPDIHTWASKGKTITVKEAMDLFKKGIVKYENAVNKALNVNISQEQFDALVSICYNIGTGGLSKSTFMKRLNNGESPRRIADAILWWNKPREIIGRRTREKNLFLRGTYSHGGKALLFDVDHRHKPDYSNAKTIIVKDLL